MALHDAGDASSGRRELAQPIVEAVRTVSKCKGAT